MSEEWQFHRRNPELFIMWASYLYAIILCVLEGAK